MNLLFGKYEGFNLTHFRKVLAVDEGMVIKKTTLENRDRRHQPEKFPRRSRKRTLQDRLLSELKLRGIWNFEGANEYLMSEFLLLMLNSHKILRRCLVSRQFQESV